MPDNRISATLSQADQQTVLAAINTIREKLPFLIDLSTGYVPSFAESAWRSSGW
jgi:hypothetical protein